MDQVVTILLGVIGLFFVLGFGGFTLISLSEGETRAMKLSSGLMLLSGAIFLLAVFMPPLVKLVLLGLLVFCGLTMIGLLVLPLGKIEAGNDEPYERVDERDIPFARARLEVGSPEFEAYYMMRPGNKPIDDRFRSKPGFLSLEARFANPFQFSATEGSFWLTGGLREAVDGPVSEEHHTLPVGEMTEFLKNLARFYGALDVGISELKPYHVYSHIGRGTGEYGDTISVDHSYAIAFTVEMDFHMIGPSPYPPTSMETGKQYVEAARIAVQLAAAIRYLGYSARAHIDGNYRVIAPLVARDAGLGEIGRMGLLMTPQQGPRVRIGVVTTDVKLAAVHRQPDPSVIDFCSLCKKCAQNCPSKSIPQGEREIIDGALRWKINADSCFLYWNVIGTDCAKCMAVCPYSHPDTFSHNLIRWGNTKSGAFRRAALRLDDLFYGKKPKTRDAPGWTVVGNP
ncbi:4Fe-4S dicluster domain-containing protein [Chloroflexota bacterium]